MRKRSFQIKLNQKSKYQSIKKDYDLNLSSSLDDILGMTRVKQNNNNINSPKKIQSNGNFKLEQFNNFQKNNKNKYIKSNITYSLQKKNNIDFKLPQIKPKNIKNPQIENQFIIKKNVFYQSKIYRSLKTYDSTYLMNLSRQHFLQTIEAIKIGKDLKNSFAKKEIKITKKNPRFKTVFLDLDQTLVHCDENSRHCTTKLNFPIQGGGYISAGIIVRPHCQQFLQSLSSFAQIIIFTASSPSYADVVLNYLDPLKSFFSYRLYRQHCSLENGFYTKDLRIVNRKLEDCMIVDNSAFSFMLQPQNGIPILPFYHYAKDKQLLELLPFLHQLIQAKDCRTIIKKTFFWSKYYLNQDPKNIFLQNYQQ